MTVVVDSLRHIVETVLLAVGALLPLVDPLSSAPIYHQLTATLGPTERAAMAKSVAFNSFLLLLGSVFVGAYVLRFFGLSIPAVQIAGGVVLCAMGWKLLNKPEVSDTVARATTAEAGPNDARRRAFYPLTMPLTVGPGSISVAIALGANRGSHARSFLITGTGHALGILTIAGTVYVCYRYAGHIVSRLGETVRSAMMRLSAFIVLCIGVQLVWNGIEALLVMTFPGAARGGR
jgi:multiple antibiotic resistance protein